MTFEEACGEIVAAGLHLHSMYFGPRRVTASVFRSIWLDAKDGEGDTAPEAIMDAVGQWRTEDAKKARNKSAVQHSAQNSTT